MLLAALPPHVHVQGANLMIERLSILMRTPSSTEVSTGHASTVSALNNLDRENN